MPVTWLGAGELVGALQPENPIYMVIIMSLGLLWSTRRNVNTRDLIAYLIIWHAQIVQSLAPSGQQGGSLVFAHHLAEHDAIALQLYVGNVDLEQTAFFVFLGRLRLASLLSRKRKLAASLWTGFMFNWGSCGIDVENWPFFS